MINNFIISSLLHVVIVTLVFVILGTQYLPHCDCNIVDWVPNTSCDKASRIHFLIGNFITTPLEKFGP